MASFNKVILAGNLTRDPEMRSTPSGAAVCEFGLAVNESYKTKSGEKVDDTLFVDVTAWNRTAEVINEYMCKGSSILIEGKLKLDTWETNGEKRSKIRVTAERFEFLNSNNGGDKRPQKEPTQSQPSFDGDDIPF